MKTHSTFPEIFEDKLGITFGAKHRASKERKESEKQIEKLNKKPISGKYNLEHLAKIHDKIFHNISTYAGSVRLYPIGKGRDSSFAKPERIITIFEKDLPPKIAGLSKHQGNDKKMAQALADIHTLVDEAHPFREGNGRSSRLFIDQLAKEHGYKLQRDVIKQLPREWVHVSKEAIGYYNPYKKTDKPELQDPEPKCKMFEAMIRPVISP